MAYFDRPKDLPEIALTCHAAIPSIYYTLPCIAPLAHHKGICLGYYVQDFKPSFFDRNNREYEQALKSYTLVESIRRFCKTEWNREVLRKQVGADCVVVGPSVDLDRYRPWSRDGVRPFTIAAMIPPNSPYRSPTLTLAVLRDIVKRHGDACGVATFGVDGADPAFRVRAMDIDFPFHHYGILTPSQLAVLLSYTDVFVDFSTHQAMGLTAMEAMACRAATIVPTEGGVRYLGSSQPQCLSGEHGRSWFLLRCIGPLGIGCRSNGKTRGLGVARRSAFFSRTRGGKDGGCSLHHLTPNRCRTARKGLALDLRVKSAFPAP